MNVMQIKKKVDTYTLIIEKGQLISDIPILEPDKVYEFKFYYQPTNKLIMAKEDYFTPKHFLVDIGIVIGDILNGYKMKIENASFTIKVEARDIKR